MENDDDDDPSDAPSADIIDLDNFRTKADCDPLHFWIEKPKSGRAYRVDLRLLRDGAFRGDRRNPDTWGGDFSGRPKIALEIAADLKREQPAKNVNRNLSINRMFRFLDRIDPPRKTSDGYEHEIISLTALPATFDIDFRNYILALGHQDIKSSYTLIKGFVERTCRAAGVLPPIWPPAPRNDRPVLQDGFSVECIVALRRAFRSEARKIKARFESYSKIADSGIDPRAVQDNKLIRSTWMKTENQAWLIRELTRFSIPSLNEIVKFDGNVLLRTGRKIDFSMNGITRSLDWFHPNKHDTYVFWWLSLLETGWNVSTNSSIDINRFFAPHPQQQDLVVLRALVFDADIEDVVASGSHQDPDKLSATAAYQETQDEVAMLSSFKRRSRSWQNAVVSRRTEFGAFRAIEFMIEKTSAIRATIKLELDSLISDKGKRRGETLRRIAELQAAIKSPWLFVRTRDRLGRVGAVDISAENDNFKNDVLRQIINDYKLFETFPELERLTASDIRDHHIAYMFEKSGFNFIVAKLVAGHANFSSLRHYLNQRRLRTFSEKEFGKFQNALISEIESHGPIDLARMRILIQNGEITEDQAARLRDWRNRSIIGVGCTDHNTPPKEIAPNHKKGDPCRESICSICWRRVVFDDSYLGIAPHFAELTYKKEQTPLFSWTGSTFEADYDATEEILSTYDVDKWTPIYQQRLAELRCKRRLPALTQAHY